MKNRHEHTAEEEDPIEAAAAAWLARRDADMDAATVAEFWRWRTVDDRHTAAVVRLARTIALLEKLPQLRHDPRLLRRVGAPPEVVPASGWHLRHFLRPLAGVAAVLAVAAGWWLWPARTSEQLSYTTTVVGYRRTELPDGSVIKLNVSSAVDIQFTATERRLNLRAGEAHFKVAKNPARPFIVTAGLVRVRAVGTMFDVRRDVRQVEVLVTEGKVAVAAGSQPTEEATISSPADTPLIAGQRLRVTTVGPVVAGQPETVSPEEIRATLAWLDQRLVLVDMPLAEVVEQFNRRNTVQLVIGDTAIASRPVGGMFHTDDVEVFLRLLEATGEITVERVNADRIVLHQAPVEQWR